MKQKHPTAPKNKSRQTRFEAWVKSASNRDLDATYARALKSYNAYQKRVVLAELRRRELAKEAA